MDKSIESKLRSRFAVAKKIVGYGVLFSLAFLLILYLMACWSIRSGVKAISSEVNEEFPGDRIEALIKYAGSENHSLRQRNMAVWALGQIGDERAMSALRKWYIGGPCDHDEFLCQHELQKAITLCEGGFNATAWLPR